MACGIYSRCIFPWLMDRVLSQPQVTEQRKKTLATARGRVVEIGMGTGLNLPHYPASVTELVAVEPVNMLPRRVQQRIAGVPFAVERVSGFAESLPLADASCDTAVSTWTLCSVRDVAKSLAELHRVLRPGGTLLFVEHGLSRDPKVARWQRWLTPLQRWLAGNCHLDRPMDALLAASPLSIERLDRFLLPPGPQTHIEMFAGIARKEAADA